MSEVDFKCSPSLNSSFQCFMTSGIVHDLTPYARMCALLIGGNGGGASVHVRIEVVHEPKV